MSSIMRWSVPLLARAEMKTVAKDVPAFQAFPFLMSGQRVLQVVVGFVAGERPGGQHLSGLNGLLSAVNGSGPFLAAL